MSASNEVENEILNLYFGGPVWVALYRDVPPEFGLDPIPSPPLAEVHPSVPPEQVGDRREARFTVQDNVATLADEIFWDDLPETTVQSIGLWTAETEGKLLFQGLMTYRRQTKAGQKLRFLPGAISVAVD